MKGRLGRFGLVMALTVLYATLLNISEETGARGETPWWVGGIIFLVAINLYAAFGDEKGD